MIYVIHVQDAHLSREPHASAVIQTQMSEPRTVETLDAVATPRRCDVDAASHLMTARGALHRKVHFVLLLLPPRLRPGALPLLLSSLLDGGTFISEIGA